MDVDQDAVRAWAYGIDLFAYSADGRTIHDAIDFMVRSITTPGETNAIYAIACPESGDRWGTIEAPSTAFIDFDADALMVYADRFPDRENSTWITSNLKVQGNVPLSEHSGGAALCQFAAPTTAVFSGPPIEVHGIVALPLPKLVVTTKEEIAIRPASIHWSIPCSALALKEHHQAMERTATISVVISTL